MGEYINQITLSGKIVSEISLRKSNKGYSVADFRIKHRNKRAKNPVFIDIEVWQDEAEKVHKEAENGSIVIVYGDIRRDVWEKDGESRSKLKITADKVIVQKITKDDGTSMAFK